MTARIPPRRHWQCIPGMLGLLGMSVVLISCSLRSDPSGPPPPAELAPRASTFASASPSVGVTVPAPISQDLIIQPANVAQLKEVANWQTRDSVPVQQVAWSPDGRTIAARVDNQVLFWDAGSGRELGSFTGSQNAITFSPDGRLLATAAGDNAVKLWNISAGLELYTLSGHSSPVRSISFSPDGTVLFAGSTYGPQKFWDVATGNEIRNLGYAVSGVVVSSAYSPDGHLLALGTGSSRGGWIELWDAARPEKVRTLLDERNDKYSIAFSPNGRWLASGSLFGNVKLWDVETGRELRTFAVPGASVRQVAFSPDGQLLAIAAHGPLVCLLQVAGWSELRTLTGYAGDVNGVTFSPDGKWLATGSADGTIRFWGIRP